MKNKISVRDLVLTALFAALVAVGAFIRIPAGDLSFTMQLFFVFLSGILLGPKYGALCVVVYLLLGLCGVPVFTSGGGIGSLLSPSFGFIIGFILTALITGLIAGKSSSLPRLILGCVLGNLAAYVIGIPYMMLILNVYMGKAMGLWALILAYMLPYLPFDALKIVLAVIIAKPLVPQIKKLEVRKGA